MRRLLPHLLPVATLAVLVALYAPTFGRSFVSEDFLIIRRLGAGEFWATVAAAFQGPWLGIEIVKFFRPVSSFLLQVELALFGLDPLPYGLVHFGVHLLNAGLFARFLRRLDPAAPPAEVWLGAGLFAAYPLHPNTVVFIASFATLFATTLVLAALLAGPKARLAWLGLALLAYEQAVFFPLWLTCWALGQELWAGDGPRSGAVWHRLLAVGRRAMPAWVVLALFLGLRHGALAAAVGGYPSFLQGVAPWALLDQGLQNIARLFFPVYAWPLPTGCQGVVVAAGLAVAWLVWQGSWSSERPEASRASRLMAAGGCWLVLALAPFVFVGVVPGNGRYFYLPSLGAVMLLLGLGRRLLAPRVRQMGLAFTLLATFGSLHGLVSAHVEAGELANTLKGQLQALGPAPGTAAGRVFVVDRPTFITRWGVPVAQVYHWGLADALLPPFSPGPAPEVYVVPHLQGQELFPLLARPELGQTVQWRDGGIHPLAAEGSPVPTLPAARDGWALTFQPRDGAGYRLVVLAPGNAAATPVPASSPAQPDPALLRSMASLYPGQPVFLWLEERDPQGQLATSTIFTLTPELLRMP